jgi:hypothetical protein
MLLFWTMERSPPFGRRPGPAGHPQRMGEAVGDQSSAAQRSEHRVQLPSRASGCPLAV